MIYIKTMDKLCESETEIPVVKKTRATIHRLESWLLFFEFLWVIISSWAASPRGADPQVFQSSVFLNIHRMQAHR